MAVVIFVNVLLSRLISQSVACTLVTSHFSTCSDHLNLGRAGTILAPETDLVENCGQLIRVGAKGKGLLFDALGLLELRVEPNAGSMQCNICLTCMLFLF